MKYFQPGILLSLLCFFSATATQAASTTSDRFRFDLNLDEEGKFNPELFIPVSWSLHWYSGLAFRERTESSQDTLDGFEDSRFGTSINENTVRFNLLSYKQDHEKLHYSVGADYQKTSIDKTEFGYFHLNNGTIDDYIAFDNNIEIEVTGFSLRGDVTWGNSTDTNRIRFSTILSPKNSLDVEQNTTFKPVVTSTGKGSSSKSQDLSYLLQLETRHDFFNFVTVGLNIQYEVLPIEYDLQVLSASVDSFQSANIDTTETTTRFGLRLIINHPLLEGLYPVIGITEEKIKTTDNNSDESDTQSQTLFSVGFTGQF